MDCRLEMPTGSHIPERICYYIDEVPQMLDVGAMPAQAQAAKDQRAGAKGGN